MTVRATALSSLLCLLVAGAALPVTAAATAQAPQVQHPRFEGGTALKANGESRTVQSQPLNFQVGHLYRLKAKVKVQGVRVDPAARYPTALGASLSMAQMPFTNGSAGVAGDRTEQLELLFFAASAKDSVQLHLGRNGKAWGQASFSDLTVEKVEDIRAYVPLEAVTWSGKGFRYEDGGWTFVHIEGEPYARGTQYGELMARDIPRFMEKLALGHDAKDPAEGWASMRAQVDALFLRKYDVEFLEEMKGIADGAAAAGATFRGRPVDLLDVVTMNSAIDLDYVGSALRVTDNPLSGRTFSKTEDQAAVAPDKDKCSSFVATGSATVDKRPIITQMFMWGGYAGVEWKVILDVKPTKGQRLVMQTFPGGIHSGADWYLNGAGMVIGETTVGQTPFDPDGSTQSNRIRRAAQYATGIDSFCDLFRKGNNGLYTNEWTLADMRTGEGADFLLGTKTEKLWRTGNAQAPADTPGNLKDFIWANNNNRSLTVRAETAANAEDAPVDLAFNTWNRDIAFWQFYQQYGKGRIDLDKAVRAMASSPISRPHGCDGKVTTGEMADQLMFMAHFGKPSHREKMVGGRYIKADLPGATPHLTEGYTTFSPIFITEKLQALKAAKTAEVKPAPKPELGDLKAVYGFEKAGLWKRSVLPATEQDFWFSSASAAYHSLLKRLPAAPDKAFETLRDALGDQAARYHYFADREGAEAPARTPVRYDRYAAYQHPRVKGTILLHQLRLLLGNASFAKVMGAVHGQYAGKPMGTADFVKAASVAAGQDLAPFCAQWLDRNDLPALKVKAKVEAKGDAFEVVLTVDQAGTPWHLLGSVEVGTAKGARLERVELKGAQTVLRLASKEKPARLRFNAGSDFLCQGQPSASLANIADRFEDLLIVWGSAQSPEAGRTLALTFQEAVAESVSEYLMPVKADGEVTDAELASRDLVVMGGAADNALLARLKGKVPVEFGRGWFRFQGKTYGTSEDGLILCVPNPWNPKRNLTLFLANSRLELWQMARTLQRGIPGWGLFKGADITGRGHLPQAGFDLVLD